MSSSSSLKYSFLGTANNDVARAAASASERLTFAAWCIFFSEESLEQIFMDVGGELFGLLDRFSLIEGQAAAKIVQHADLPAQGNFEILETAWLPVRVAPRFDHRLMRIMDGVG